LNNQPFDLGSIISSHKQIINIQQENNFNSFNTSYNPLHSFLGLIVSNMYQFLCTMLLELDEDHKNFQKIQILIPPFFS